MARLAFLGTPAVAVPALSRLVKAGHEVGLVVSRPDRRRGRGGDLSPSPVKAAAQALGLDVTSRLDDVLGVDAELGVVVAYGRIVPGRVLDVLPMLNVHFSLLPRWRGAAPVERAVLAGDEETGVCLMRLDEGLDTGPVVAARRVRIGENEPVDELGRRLSEVGASLLVEALAGGVEALPEGDPQVGEPTHAAKIEPGELRIDWSKPATELARLVRLGRAWTTFRGRRLRVLRAVGSDAVPSEIGSAPGGTPGSLQGNAVLTGRGSLELLSVQPEGRAAMATGDWLRGAKPRPEELLV